MADRRPDNLPADIPTTLPEQLIETLVDSQNVRMERTVSTISDGTTE